MDQKWGMGMAFGVVDNTQQLNMGIGRKKKMEIACECWFTSKGKMQPLMFKYQDEQGEIHTIKEIQVHSREEKNLMASPYTEFGVTINCQGIYMEAKLIFYKKECRWVMVTGQD
ncbi:MAG: hypothetical protein K2N15_05220 [Lachnospiraceae bacterium]|nr:hypothetical protein [Lachnospiraceae bacterium]